MRILICTSEYFPYGSGIANVAYNVVQQFKKSGCECTVCSPTGPDIILGRSDLIQKFGILGILYYWFRVSLFFKKNNYDHVWLNNPLILLNNPFQNCLVTVHTTYFGLVKCQAYTGPMYYYNKISSVIEKFCLTKFEKSLPFTTASEQVRSELELIGIDRNRISIIRNGVDTKLFIPRKDKYQLRKKFGLSEGDIILLSVGRLTELKQPYCLLKIFSEVEKKKENISLCFAGRGELLESSKQTAQDLKIKKVKFLGFVDSLPELYACADYYIMTSKYEGFPVTLPEAMSSGLRCIVSNIPSLNIVKEAECGLIADMPNVSIATEKILNYISKNNDHDGENARSFSERNLNWEKISKHYLEKFLGN